MARRRPARLLAPLALIAAVVATFLVATASLRDDDEGASAGDRAAATQTQRQASTVADDAISTTPRKRKQPRTYTVQPGDILSTVSEQTGVSVEELQALNPEVDPQALQVGQVLKLTPGAETDDTP